jgi:hypothetical protein
MTRPSATPGTLDRARAPIAAVARRIALVGALALTGVAVSVPAASAGEDEVIRTKRGLVKFQPSGDYLIAYDTLRDGYGVYAKLTWNDSNDVGHERKIHDPDSTAGPPHRNLSLHERTTVWLEMCYTKNGDDVKCSLSQRAKA